MKPQKHKELTPDMAGMISQPLEAEKQFDFETHEFKTLKDFETWNFYARKAHREARKFDRHAQPPYPIKVPTEEFHEKVRVRFQRFDQPENVLKTVVRNKDIQWQGQLKPGSVYDLPKPVIKFLNTRSVPIFGEVQVNDGSETKTETKQVGERARFACQRLDEY